MKSEITEKLTEIHNKAVELWPEKEHKINLSFKGDHWFLNVYRIDSGCTRFAANFTEETASGFIEKMVQEASQSAPKNPSCKVEYSVHIFDFLNLEAGSGVPRLNRMARDGWEPFLIVESKNLGLDTKILMRRVS